VAQLGVADHLVRDQDVANPRFHEHCSLANLLAADT
jgi:hypothetical protein